MWKWVQSVFGPEEIELVPQRSDACCDCVFWARDGFSKTGECVAHYSKSNIYLSADGKPARIRMTTTSDFHCKNFMKKEIT